MHEWWQWFLAIPLGGLGVGLIALLLDFGHKTVDLILKSKERRLQMRLESQGGGGDVSRQIQQLRDEIAQMRDTTTAYDLSIDSQLQNLARRMEFLERQRIGSLADQDATQDEPQRLVRPG